MALLTISAKDRAVTIKVLTKLQEKAIAERDDCEADVAALNRVLDIYRRDPEETKRLFRAAEGEYRFEQSEK